MLKSMIYYSFFCIVFLGVVNTFSINPCSHGGLVPDEVSIANCSPDAATCTVQSNGVLNMTMKFKAPHYLDAMKPNLKGKSVLGDFNFTETAPDSDVCKGILNTMCPVVAKETVEFSYSVNMLVFPALSVNLEFSIMDLARAETAVCFSFDVFPVS